MLFIYVCVRELTSKMLQKTHSRNLLLKVVRYISTEITESKIKVKDININYVKSGNGRKSLLLMPGTLGSAWTDFKPQIENLPAILPDYTIIAWDPPGYGKSIPPKRNFNLQLFHNDAQCAIDFMQALGRKPFSIVGWSGGAITAMIIAGTNQDLVEKIVVCGAGAYISENEKKSFEALIDVNQWSEGMRKPMEELYGAKRFREMWSEWVVLTQAFWQQCDGNFCKKEVTQIKAPTLIVRGKKDNVITAEHVPYLQKHITNTRYYEFANGKHNLHLKYSEEFNSLICNFLI